MQLEEIINLSSKSSSRMPNSGEIIPYSARPQVNPNFDLCLGAHLALQRQPALQKWVKMRIKSVIELL